MFNCIISGDDLIRSWRVKQCRCSAELSPISGFLTSQDSLTVRLIAVNYMLGMTPHMSRHLANATASLNAR
jgi:hypothetical protein